MGLGHEQVLPGPPRPARASLDRRVLGILLAQVRENCRSGLEMFVGKGSLGTARGEVRGSRSHSLGRPEPRVGPAGSCARFPCRPREALGDLDVLRSHPVPPAPCLLLQSLDTKSRPSGQAAWSGTPGCCWGCSAGGRPLQSLTLALGRQMEPLDPSLGPAQPLQGQESLCSRVSGETEPLPEP